MSTTYFNKLDREQQFMFISNILSGALHDNHWVSARMDEDTYNTHKRPGDIIEEVWARAILDGCALTIIYRGEDKAHDIMLEDILTGLDLLQENHPKVWARIICNDGDDDMWDYDALLQYAVFKDWIYG